jgi:Tfp pilus assembly PilM family ATPase
MQLLGIHLDQQSITLALVTKEKAGFKIKFLESFPIALEGEAHALEHKLQVLALKEQPFFITAPLETCRILLRTLEIPLKGKKALFCALPFQLENMIPYPIGEMIVVPIIEQGISLKEKASSIITLFCVQQKAYQEYLTQLKMDDLDPQWIGCIPQALYRFAQHYTKETAYILLHMSDRATHIIAVLENRLCSVFQIELGKEDFLEAIAQDHPNLHKKELSTHFEKLSPLEQNLTHVGAKVEKFLQELDRVFYFLLHKKEGRRIESIIFTKEEKFLASFKERIERSLDFSLEVIDMKDANLVHLKPYAIPIGSAIDVLVDDHKTLQFRSPKDIQKRLKTEIIKKLGTCTVTMLASMLLVAGSAHWFLKSKEKALHNKLTTTLSQYAQEVGPITTNMDFFASLKRAEKSVNQAKKSYGYHLMPVKVGDFLKFMNDTMQTTSIPLLKLKEFRYELVHYPTLAQPLQPYEIKIDLVMTAEEEKQLREFFEALLKNAEWVADNPKPTLNQERHQYAATFFLAPS